MGIGVGIIYLDQYLGCKPLCRRYTPSLPHYILTLWVCRVERFGVLGSGCSVSSRGLWSSVWGYTAFRVQSIPDRDVARKIRENV